MSINWDQWEGRVVDGKYLLKNYLGGSEGQGAFRTELVEAASRTTAEQATSDLPPKTPEAVIKIILAETADTASATPSADQIANWRRAVELSHPNLIRIFAVGRTTMDEREAAYVVEEFAEENLAQIVPERALTVEEVRGMLDPLLTALEYVHDKGLVHGRVRPANIHAIGDAVKLSSDSVRPAGFIPTTASGYDAPEVGAHGISDASDVWALGMTIAEVMTQHLPEWDPARMSAPENLPPIPAPFDSVVRHCLEIEPQRRWGLREIRKAIAPGADISALEKLRPVVSSEAAAPKRAALRWMFWMLLLAAVIIAGVVYLSHTGSTIVDTTSSIQSSMQQQPPAPVSGAPATSERTPTEQPSIELPKPEPENPDIEKNEKSRTEPASKDGVVSRVMPDVSASARRTIHGKIKVAVKVSVDADGNVTTATLTDAGPSKYFARLALDAANHWKFASADDKSAARQWTLRFTFTRSQTEARASRG